MCTVFSDGFSCVIKRRTVFSIYVYLLWVVVTGLELGRVALAVDEMARSLGDTTDTRHVQVLRAADLLELIATSDWTGHRSRRVD